MSSLAKQSWVQDFSIGFRAADLTSGFVLRKAKLKAFNDTDLLLDLKYRWEGGDAKFSVMLALDPSSDAPTADVEARNRSLEATCSLTIKNPIGREVCKTLSRSALPLNTIGFHAVRLLDVLGPGLSPFMVSLSLQCSRDAPDEHQIRPVPPSASVDKFVSPLLDDPELSDVLVECGDKIFCCHKVVLAAHSEVFRAMVSNKFKEGVENKINVGGFGPDAVELMLKFIYEDIVAESSVSWDLFAVARFYAVIKLEAICLNVLSKQLNIYNCVEMLEAASAECMDDAFDKAAEFVRKNKAAVIETDNWKQFVADNSHLEESIFKSD